MKRFKKAGMLVIFLIPALVGAIGHLIDGQTIPDTLYKVIKMYGFSADTCKNNIFIEIARWAAPLVTISGLALILQRTFARVVDFFRGFSKNAIALYGDATEKEIVHRNINETINVTDGKVMDVNKHIIMFSSDEKAIEFYAENKEKLRGEIFMMLEKRDGFTVELDNVKVFNPYEIIARRFWHKRDLRGLFEKDEMKISIVGSNVLARKMLTDGLLNNIYTLTQKVGYHLWSEDGFFEQAHADFKTMNEDIVTYHSLKAQDAVFGIAESDRIIFTEKVDNELLFEIVKLTKGEIYLFDPKDTFVNIFGYDKIYTFGKLNNILTEENISAKNTYTLAKELNYDFALKYPKKDESVPTSADEAWGRLNTFTKGSNVASADYHKIRLIVMTETKKTKPDEVLCEMEHIRWCRYHYLNHWKYGETEDGKKDEAKKIHPCLKPFGALDPATRLKDKDGIDTLLKLEGIL